MKHSKYFSPSSISRRIICHGSAFLEEQVADEEPKPAADWGSFAHHIVDAYLKDAKPIESWFGKEMFGQECDAEMISAVRQVIEDIDELLIMCPDGQVDTEQFVDLAWLGYPEMFGTCDFSSDKLFDTLVVEDHKFGSGVSVEPKDNPQPMAYALMTAGQALLTYKRIVIAISQPRNKTNGKSLKIWETTPEYLMQWFKDTLEPTIVAIKNGSDTLRVTEDGCRFCRAKDICPEFSKHSLELARIDFADSVPRPPVVDEKLVNDIYQHLPMFKEWLKRIEGKAYEMACSGQLNGFKLVAGRRSREWLDESAAVSALQGLGLDPYIKKILSPAQAEKQGGKEAKNALKTLINVSDGKPVIAPANDRRKAISLAAEDFKHLTN